MIYRKRKIRLPHGINKELTGHRSTSPFGTITDLNIARALGDACLKDVSDELISCSVKKSTQKVPKNLGFKLSIANCGN